MQLCYPTATNRQCLIKTGKQHIWILRYSHDCIFQGIIFSLSEDIMIYSKFHEVIIDRYLFVTWNSEPTKHQTLNQCWFNVGPPSTTSAQHWPKHRFNVSCLLGSLHLRNCDRIVLISKASLSPPQQLLVFQIATNLWTIAITFCT